jgi:hypothetical protein
MALNNMRTAALASPIQLQRLQLPVPNGTTALTSKRDTFRPMDVRSLIAAIVDGSNKKYAGRSF